MTIGRPENDALIDLSTIRSILFLRHDRIGDMIVTTPFFRILKQKYPSLKIGVIASETNAEIIRFNKSVDSLYRLPKNPLQKILMLMKLRRENYDVVINLIFNRTTSIALLMDFIAKNGITVSQGDEKYRFYFDRYCTVPRASGPMVSILAEIMKRIFALPIEDRELDYEITVDPRSKEEVASFLSKHNLLSKSLNSRSNYIVFNLSAVDTERKISVDQASQIISFLAHYSGYKVVVVTAPNDTVMQDFAGLLRAKGACLLFMENGFSSLLQLAALIESAAVVLSPDTSVIHFASAMKTPIIGFFTPLQGMREWFPFHVEYACVPAEPGHSVSEIPPDCMIKEISSFFDKVLEK
jgi:ADP-heptose:LPS heptosyltransferase